MAFPCSIQSVRHPVNVHLSELQYSVRFESAITLKHPFNFWRHVSILNGIAVVGVAASASSSPARVRSSEDFRVYHAIYQFKLLRYPPHHAARTSPARSFHRHAVQRRQDGGRAETRGGRYIPPRPTSSRPYTGRSGGSSKAAPPTGPPYRTQCSAVRSRSTSSLRLRLRRRRRPNFRN